MKIPDTLFARPVSPSPRLRWIKEYKITTYRSEGMDVSKGDEPWSAFIGTWDDISSECVLMEGDGRLCYGTTEDEALQKLAIAQGWKLWNEQ